jgi:hypothetical protein
VDGQVDVDEEELPRVEHGADPVADVGDDKRALQRRGLLAGDQGNQLPHPEPRRPRLEEAAAQRPPLHRRVVPGVLAGPEELGLGALLGAGGRLAGIGQLLGQVEGAGADPPAPRPDQLLLAVAQRGLDQLHAAAGADDPRLDLDRTDRHRAQDLEGEAADLEVVRVLERLDLAADQRRRRPGVLGARIPGTAGQLGGPEAVAVALVEGIGHARILRS